MGGQKVVTGSFVAHIVPMRPTEIGSLCKGTVQTAGNDCTHKQFNGNLNQLEDQQNGNPSLL
ncbi:predicted protein [Histoplasma mississippiense (nom. inval.)]|uniref:predicted protein n=1 Tax=Ajellomyces capsulatus (strain NAm1 / WU24) TaxID=2059318 RepID=UPI000157D3E0|nr:predicted protein [Histoplasma mississippiense (nom. inval.)]EDN04553.1 predicted protein [Histoplasma mississippiense (nom. inval.)]